MSHDPASIRRVLVLGTGTMGQGIAQVSALAGYVTHLYDIDAGRIDKAIDANVRIEVGPVVDTVIEIVEKVNADLIVVGTHGRTGFAHLVLGSVAERIVRRSPVPVLSVRRTEKSAAGETVPLGDLASAAV